MTKEEKAKQNLLIDCTYIRKRLRAEDSLVIYAGRLIQGLLRYGHYSIHVLLWREKEDILDSLAGQAFEKIVLDHDDVPLRYYTTYYRMLGILPPRLKEELSRRKITKVIQPSHYLSFFHYTRPFEHYVVLHDLFYYDYNREARGKLSYFKWTLRDRMFLRRYKYIITISNAVHDELLEHIGKESLVLHNSLAFDFDIPEETVEAVRGKKYILDINSFQKRKNTAMMIRALALLKDSIPHVLYLKGNHYDVVNRPALEELVSELGLEDRVIIDIAFRTEGEIRYLYTHADLFISPSLKEGFGWTPVEAAILKTPVLVSDLEVFREITCGRIPTFDPHSPEDLAAHILEILNDPPSGEEKTELAGFFLEQYSLKKQIERLEEILDNSDSRGSK